MNSIPKAHHLPPTPNRHPIRLVVFILRRPPRFNENVKVIQIDICAEELGNNVHAAVALNGNLPQVVDQVELESTYFFIKYITCSIILSRYRSVSSVYIEVLCGNILRIQNGGKF